MDIFEELKSMSLSLPNDTLEKIANELDKPNEENIREFFMFVESALMNADRLGFDALDFEEIYDGKNEVKQLLKTLDKM